MQGALALLVLSAAPFLGAARRGAARHGSTRLGPVQLGLARHGTARHGAAQLIGIICFRRGNDWPQQYWVRVSQGQPDSVRDSQG